MFIDLQKVWNQYIIQQAQNVYDGETMRIARNDENYFDQALYGDED